MKGVREINISTSQKEEFLDITDRIRRIVKESGVEDGICVIYIPHTTAGIFINEGADPSVVADIKKALKSFGFEKMNFSHLEGNSPSHIKSTLIGSNISLIIDRGEILLGRWQSIFFAEFDGPRRRKVYVKIIGA